MVAEAHAVADWVGPPLVTHLDLARTAEEIHRIHSRHGVCARAVPRHQPEAHERAFESLALGSRAASVGAVDVLVEVARPDDGALRVTSAQLFESATWSRSTRAKDSNELSLSRAKSGAPCRKVAHGSTLP
jgi:hypothetical protein